MKYFSCSSIWQPKILAKIAANSKSTVRKSFIKGSTLTSCKCYIACLKRVGRLEMCYWLLEKMKGDSEFLSTVTSSDEANFYVLGEVNRENETLVHHQQASKKQLTSLCSMWKDESSILAFFKMLWSTRIARTLPDWFMQDGAPPH